jgi:hypothetical protein
MISESLHEPWLNLWKQQLCLGWSVIIHDCLLQCHNSKGSAAHLQFVLGGTIKVKSLPPDAKLQNSTACLLDDATSRHTRLSSPQQWPCNNGQRAGVLTQMLAAICTRYMLSKRPHMSG